MDKRIDELAARLRSAYKDGAIPPLRDDLDPLDAAGAYAVQHANTGFWQAAGRRIVGRKVGLTAKAVQAQLGVDQPDFGVLFADMAIADGGTLRTSGVHQPKAEAEVAIVLARDLDHPAATANDVFAAADHAVAAIEIVDSRIADWKITFADTVADNGSSAFFVLGTEKKPLPGLDLYTCGMALEINGALMSLGAGAACLGHPLEAAAWLARTLAAAGIVDAKLGWNAYEGVDMRGKIAVVLANDPDFEGGRDLGFEGRRLAYAGRVGVKFAAAEAAGAAGVLVIHEDAAASYPFLQVASGDALPAMVPAPLKPSPTFALTGWLRRDAAVDLLARAGLDLEALKIRARDPQFQAFAMGGATLTAAGDLKATSIISHNVIGKLVGASRPAEYVLYGAHWDANGQNGPVAGDGIRNGAIDNATGTSEVIEVARALAAGKRPARTTVFAAWTAEEKGLLGSDYYAAHPVYPLATTAAMINLDPHVALPAARDLELIGSGRVSLETDLRAVAAARNLKVVDDPAVEAGWYFRSDQFSFAKRGVPAITFRGGRDLVDGGSARGSAIVSACNAKRYHQPSDEFDPSWTFAGSAQEATAAYDLGLRVANSSTWPTWQANSDYAPLRAATEDQRR